MRFQAFEMETLIRILADRCVAISTQSAVHEMILPGLYAVFSPMAVGLLVGPRCLIGMLGGAITSGMMLAITMANAGGAWDNSKKYVGKLLVCRSFVPKVQLRH